MRKYNYGLIILFLAMTFLISNISEVRVANGMEPRIKVETVDGSVSGRPRTLKVTNGSLTDNSGGTFTLETATSYTNTVIVAKSGGDYTTIQAALTASGADTLILVYPGTYTDDTIHFTANNQEVRGMGISPASVYVTTASSNICDFYAFTRCRVNRIKMDVTAATTLVNTVQGEGGNCAFVKCHTIMTTTYATGGTQPACIHSSSGSTFKVSEGTIEYNHTGSNIAIAKAPITWEDNSSDVTLEFANINITCSGSSFVTGISFGTGTATLAVDRCVGIIDDPDAGIIAGMYIGAATAGTGGSATAGEFIYNTLHITGGGALATGVYVNVAGAVIRGMFNHIHVSGSTANNSYFLTDVASTVTSQFEDIVAVDGVSNVSGTCTFNYVNSPVDGDLCVSGDLEFGGEASGDTIVEKTSGAGVTIETVLLKDGNVDGRDVSVDGATLDALATSTADVTLEYKLYRSALSEAYTGYIDCQLVISDRSDYDTPVVDIDTGTAQTSWLAYGAASDSYEAWSASGMPATDVRSIIYIGANLTRGTVYYYRWRTYKHGDTATATDYKGGVLCQ